MDLAVSLFFVFWIDGTSQIYAVPQIDMMQCRLTTYSEFRLRGIQYKGEDAHGINRTYALCLPVSPKALPRKTFIITKPMRPAWLYQADDTDHG